MLRALVVLLLLANLAFFAWTRGVLAPAFAPPRHADHEPGRFANQLNAEAVRVLAPTAASAAVVAARAAAAVCLEAGPLRDSDIVAAEALLASALAPANFPTGSWTREPLPPPPRWLVYAGRVPDAAARRAREAELRRLGLEFELLEAPADLAPGLVLARHATRAEAEAALAVLAAASAPLKGARVVSLPVAPALAVLRFARVLPEQQARLQALPAEAFAGGFKPCAGAARP
ncbi:MAG: hypothetical protein C0505_09100 [Leptothrix sp. (in: Bacteria)]|nr:hypothetical protein [Leptothrix sp. (in: b-proteobacteria)]